MVIPAISGGKSDQKPPKPPALDITGMAVHAEIRPAGSFPRASFFRHLDMSYPKSATTAVVIAFSVCLASTSCGPRFANQPAKDKKAKTEAPATEPKAKVIRPAKPEEAERLRIVRAFRDWGVRETAADALARIGDAAVPSLVETLQDPDRDVRAQAARALARMGPRAEPAIPALIAALNDSDKEVRMGAARALGQIGPAASEAVPDLIKAIKDPRNKPVEGSGDAREQVKQDPE